MINKNQIDQVVTRIVEGYHPSKIILFGSYAYGAPTEQSDIDLLLIKDDTLPKIQRNRVARSFIKDILFPVDIVVKTSAEFRDLKDVVGTIVYAANKYGKIIYG